MDKVLLTGGNGFLGKVIKSKLNNVITLGKSGNNNIQCDLSKHIPCFDTSFDVVVHAAGLAHFAPKKERYNIFFDVNVQGTKNLLLALDRSEPKPKSLVFISSIAVYGLVHGLGIKEETPLNAKKPYGKSKIYAEKLIQEWCDKNNIVCCILRLPLIMGQNPLGNLKDMIKGIQKGYYFNIDGGKAKKSMVMVEDVAEVISKVVEVGGIFNLTDGYHPSFYELSAKIALQFGKTRVLNLPKWAAIMLASIGDTFSKFPINSDKFEKLVSELTFDDSKARSLLGWNPNRVLEKMVL